MESTEKCIGMLFMLFMSSSQLVNFATAQIPEDIRAGATSPSTAIITWSPIPNAPTTARYWYRQLNPSASSWISQTATTVILENLSSASTYRYQIQYCRSGGTGCTQSQNVYVRTQPKPTEPGFLDKSMPHVNNVTIIPYANSIYVSWRPPVVRSEFDKFHGYSVAWCAGLSCSAEATHRIVTATSTLLDGLQSATQYSILVRTSNPPYLSRASQINVETSVGMIDDVISFPISDNAVAVVWRRVDAAGPMTRYWLRLQDRNWIATNDTYFGFNSLRPNRTYSLEMQFCMEIASRCGGVRRVEVRTAEASTSWESMEISNLQVIAAYPHALDLVWIGGSVCDSYSGAACTNNDRADCVSFTTPTANHTLTGLEDFTRYNVSVWCVANGKPGPQLTVMGNTTISSDLANLRATAAIDSVTLTWIAKERELAPAGKVWFRHPLSREWEGTTGDNLTLTGLTSASSFDIKAEYCADEFTSCGVPQFLRTRTLPANGETYDLDKSIGDAENLTVIDVSTNSVALSWRRVYGATLYEVEVRRCNGRNCPLETSFSTMKDNAVVDGLEDLTRYNISVRSVMVEQGFFYKSEGALTTATTLPSPLTKFEATALSLSVELTWTPKQSNTYYEYQYKRTTAKMWSRTRSNIVLVFNDLNPHTTYTFQARFCGGSQGPCSEPVNATVNY